MKYFQYIIVGTILIVLASCTINEISLPSWDTNWKIYFNTDVVSMSEVLTESSLKDSLTIVDGDTLDLVYVNIADTTEPEQIDRQDLAFKPDDDQIVEEIGDIELDDPDPRRTRPRTLPELFPNFDLPGNVGQDVIIPDTTIIPENQNVTFDSYQTITIKKGVMFLVFINNLTLDIDSGLVISVYDSVSGLKIGDFEFSEVTPSGDSLQSSDVSIAGQQLSNTVTLNYVVPIIGTNGSPHTVSDADVNSSFSVNVHLHDVDVTSAVAEVPEQKETKYDASALDSEDKEVISAQIQEGMVHLNITNKVPVSANIKITILSIVDANDEPLTTTKFVPADSVTQLEVNLADHKIINSKFPGSDIPLDSINYEVEVTSIPTPKGKYVKIYSTDQVLVDMEMDSIFVSDFHGNINNKKITIDPVEKDDLIDLGDLDGSFRLPDLNLVFTFYNEIDFDISLELTISAEKEENGVVTESRQINIIRDINRGQSGNPVTTRVVLDANSTSPSIVDLMEIFPTRIKVDGTGYINGTGNVVLGDELWANYTIESPLKINIQDPMKINMDLSTIEPGDMDKDARSAIADDLNDVAITLEFENGLPLTTNVLFVMALDSNNIFNQQDDSTNIFITTNLEAGQVDGSGLVSNPTQNTNKILLSKEDLQLFTKQDNAGNYLPIYYRAQALIDTTNAPVLFRKSDNLKYNGSLETKYKVDVNDK